MGVIVDLLLGELEKNGFSYDDIDDLDNHIDFYSPIVVEIILRWLPHVYDEHLGSGICVARSLINGTMQAYDPAILIDLFENSNHNASIKSGIDMFLPCQLHTT